MNQMLKEQLIDSQKHMKFFADSKELIGNSLKGL